MANILVTGATGKVARALCPLLVKKGHTVRALVRAPATARDLADQGVELYPGDFGRADTLLHAFAGIERAFIVTPPHQDAALWVYRLLEAARASRRVHLVRLSAFKAAVDAPSEDVRLHALSEQHIAGSGFPFTFLRPQFYMQNLLLSWTTIAYQSAFGHGAGDGKLSMIDARDVVDAALQVLDQPTPHVGRTYTLTGPASITFHDVAKTLTSVLGRPIEYRQGTPLQVALSLLNLGVGEWTAKVLGEQSYAFSMGWGDLVTDDVRTLTGHAARTFAQFAEEVLAPAVKPHLPKR